MFTIAVSIIYHVLYKYRIEETYQARRNEEGQQTHLPIGLRHHGMSRYSCLIVSIKAVHLADHAACQFVGTQNISLIKRILAAMKIGSE